MKKVIIHGVHSEIDMDICIIFWWNVMVLNYLKRVLYFTISSIILLLLLLSYISIIITVQTQFIIIFIIIIVIMYDDSNCKHNLLFEQII